LLLYEFTMFVVSLFLSFSVFSCLISWFENVHDRGPEEDGRHVWEGSESCKPQCLSWDCKAHSLSRKRIYRKEKRWLQSRTLAWRLKLKWIHAYNTTVSFSCGRTTPINTPTPRRRVSLFLQLDSLMLGMWYMRMLTSFLWAHISVALWWVRDKHGSFNCSCRSVMWRAGGPFFIVLFIWFYEPWFVEWSIFGGSHGDILVTKKSKSLSFHDVLVLDGE